jgi:glutaredoxin
MSLLSRLTKLRKRWKTPHLKVSVYTRQQCCCCHKALELLREYQPRAGFDLIEVDIDRDAEPELRSRFDTLVPVVVVDGKIRFKGVVNPSLLERLLEAESSHDRPAGRTVSDD